jgi:RND family efflux transporter MFP subunit
MGKLKRLITLTAGTAIALICFSTTAAIKTDKGIVCEIIEHSLTSHIKFPPDFYADITWVVAPGTYVKGPIYDKNGKKVRKGDLLAKCDPRHFQAKFDAAEGVLNGAKGDLKDARIDYDRQKKLVATKTISEKDRDEAEATLYRALGAYKSASAELELAKIKLGYCQLEAPFDGFISEVYITRGGWSNIDYPVARLDRLCPLYVDVKIDREIAKKIVNQELSVTIKVKGIDKEIGAYNSRIELSDTGLRIPVDNYIIPIDKELEGKTVVSEVVPVIRFDLRYKANKELAIWPKCIFKDSKGSYVWKAVGQKTMQPGKTIDKKFKVEKVYVVPANEFRESISGQMQKLQDPGSLQQYDCLLANEPKDLKDGDEVYYNIIQTLFWPGDEVEIIIKQE